ncbi:unnamed protein product [Lactuca virosa]|uniref:Uncharacterized protein n=1 Tax=Lactuca virosa TaxID=75947 RepID=A0AAU9M2C1_9ASTR|nr:unnamed protein product [Lactuca virosa]
MCMLVTLVSSLSQFQCPFAATTIPKSPKPTSASDEETIDRSQSYLMEGMHFLSEVSSRTKAQTELLTSHQLKFEEGLQALKPLHKINDKTEGEAKELREKVLVLSERNQCPVHYLNESLDYQEELKRLNEDLQWKSDDVISRHAAATKEPEELS